MKPIKKTKKWLLICLFFIVGLTGVFSACSSSSQSNVQEVVRVACWGTPEELKMTKFILREWEKKHQGIKIRIEHTNYSNYLSKILTQLAAGAAPDVICTEVDMFVQLQSKDVFEPLNSYLERDPEISKLAFFEPVMKRFTVNDEVYVLPRDTAPFACVFYNKQLFDEASLPYPKDNWTMDDLLEMAKKLTKTDSNGKITQYGFYSWAWMNFVYGAGGQLVDNVDQPTRCLLDLPESIKGLEFYVDLIHRYQVMPTPTSLSNLGMGIQGMFATNQLAMFASGIWETPVLRNKVEVLGEQGTQFRWDVAMFPSWEGQRGFGTGGTGYAITKKSKNKEAAWQVLKVLTGRHSQEKIADFGLAQPSRVEVAEGPYWAESESLPLNKKMLNQAVQYVVYSPFHSRWGEIESSIIRPKLELAFNGTISVQKAVDDMIDEVNELLDEE